MIRILASLFFLLPLAACEDSHEWHQKLTLSIDTPTGPVTASTVQAIRWTGLTGFAREAVAAQQGSSGDFKITGEAAVIELAPDRYLFALLRGTGGFVGNPGENLAYALLEQRGEGGYVGTPETVALVAALPPGEPLPLPPEAWPMLVTFTDITDPASVVQVDATNLAATFGPGYALTGVTVEVTEDAVTVGAVEAVLGWWTLLRSGPMNEMISLRLPNQSPRGWDHLDALSFWSLDRLVAMGE
jgi:hypothetical protein